MSPDSEYLPVFGYGTLRDEPLHGLSFDRRTGARVHGLFVEVSERFPAVIFQADEMVEGELFWLEAESFQKSLAKLDSFEDVPWLFRRVRVEAHTEGDTVLAYAYEWVGDTWRAYSEAAERKLALASYHENRLTREIEGSGHPVAVQAHFEGVLYATIAASDQVAEAINRRWNLGLSIPNLQASLEAMPASPLRRSLFKWQQEPIGADLRELRRRATHHYYWKGRSGPRIAVQLPLHAKAYGGSRELVPYCRAVLSYAQKLEGLIRRLRETGDQ